MVPAKDFKRRMVVEIDGAPHMIEQIQVQTPSARGAATLYKIKARNLKTKNRIEKSYRGTDSLNESSFERRPVQYLYRDADELHFMDSTSFNQFSISADELRDQAGSVRLVSIKQFCNAIGEIKSLHQTYEHGVECGRIVEFRRRLRIVPQLAQSGETHQPMGITGLFIVEHKADGCRQPVRL